MPALSPRRLEIVEALPLEPGLRVLEIGCGPGAMAREIAARIGNGHILAIDRSAKAVEQARQAAAILAGRMSVRHCAAEDLCLLPGKGLYDLAVAIRVGALDGRHPGTERQARAAMSSCLRPGGVLYIDGGSPCNRPRFEAPMGTLSTCFSGTIARRARLGCNGGQCAHAGTTDHPTMVVPRRRTHPKNGV